MSEEKVHYLQQEAIEVGRGLLAGIHPGRLSTTHAGRLSTAHAQSPEELKRCQIITLTPTVMVSTVSKLIKSRVFKKELVQGINKIELVQGIITDNL